MKKIINKPENYVDEMLEGLYAAHPDYITYTADDLRCLVTSNKVAGKVGIVTGGGSGTSAIIPGICWKRYAGWLLCRRWCSVTKPGTGDLMLQKK